MGEEPEAEERCFEPCPGDCEVRGWGAWAPACLGEEVCRGGPAPPTAQQTRTRELMLEGEGLTQETFSPESFVCTADPRGPRPCCLT